MRGLSQFGFVCLVLTSSALGGPRRWRNYVTPTYNYQPPQHEYAAPRYQAPEESSRPVAETPRTSFAPWRDHNELWVSVVGNERKLFYYPTGAQPSDTTQLMLKKNGCLVDKDNKPLGSIVSRKAQDFMLDAYEKIEKPTENVEKFIRRRESMKNFERSQMGPTDDGKYDYQRAQAQVNLFKSLVRSIERALLTEDFERVVVGVSQSNDNLKIAAKDLEDKLFAQNILVSKEDIEDLAKLFAKGEIQDMKFCTWDPFTGKRDEMFGYLLTRLSAQTKVLRRYQKLVECEPEIAPIDCRR